MPGRGGNQPDFSRPKDKGDKWGGTHDNKKEGSMISYPLSSGFYREPMEAASDGAKRAGTKKGSGKMSPKRGPEQTRTKGRVVGRKGSTK